MIQKRNNIQRIICIFVFLFETGVAYGSDQQKSILFLKNHSAMSNVKILNSFYYGGVTKVSNGSNDRIISCGVPDGILLSDISPDKITMEHLTPLLDLFKRYVETDSLPSFEERSFDYLEGAYYLFSFVSDKRFSAQIYKKYAEPLFNRYGEKEPEVVRLYYLTGGSLKILRTLYKKTKNANIRKTIRDCFLREGILLDKREEKIKPVTSMDYPLFIKISCKKQQSSQSKEIKNEYNIVVDFEKRSNSPFCFDILGCDLNYNLHPSLFIIQRKDGRPVVKKKEKWSVMQHVELNPGDHLIKKSFFCFTKRINNKGGFLYAASIFRAAFLGESVFLNRNPNLVSGSILAYNVDENFSFDIQFKQEYVISTIDGLNKKKVAYSNVKTLRYILEDKIDYKKKMWEEINRRFQAKKRSGRIITPEIGRKIHLEEFKLGIWKWGKRGEEIRKGRYVRFLDFLYLTEDAARKDWENKIRSGEWVRDKKGGIILTRTKLKLVFRGGYLYSSVENANNIWDKKLKSGEWKKDGKGGVIREDGSVYRGGYVYNSLKEANDIWDEKIKSGEWKKDGKGGIIFEDGAVFRKGMVFNSIEEANQYKK